MNRNTHFEEQLDRFARAEITLAELTAFADANGIQNLDEELTLYRAAMEGLHQAAIRKRLVKVHEAFIKEEKNTSIPKQAKVVGIRTWAMRIAASIILLMGLFFLQQQVFVPQEKLEARLFTSYYVINDRSADEPGMTTFFQDFLAERYDEVNNSFATLSNPGSREYFMAGYAALRTGALGLAQQRFEKILSDNMHNPTPLYQDEAEYFLANTLLAMQDYEKAYAAFSGIANNPQHIYAEKVKRIDLFRLWVKKVTQ